MESENARWWNSETVAVVTGGNRGIGYEIVRQLAQQGLTVVLTARHESRGMAALHTLALTNVFFHSLDVQNAASIHNFALWLKNKFGKLHILINNAALNGVDVDYDYLKSQKLELKDIIKRKDFSERIYRVHHDNATNCIDVNYYGAKRTIEAMLQLLDSNSNGGARIINVSSSYGLLMQLRDKYLQQWMDKVENLTVNYIEEDFIGKFLEDIKKGEWSTDGKVWPSKHPVYKMSKIALNAYTRLLARKFVSSESLQCQNRQDQPLSNINDIHKRTRNSQVFINCIHPGDVKTQLSFNSGDLSPSEGADPIVKLALMPADCCPTGEFFYRYNASNF